MQMRHRMLALLPALFVLATVSGISAVDPCTVSLPAVAIRGEECPDSRSEIMNEIKQNISTLLQDVVHCRLAGRTPENPANSCAELADQEPDIPSGNYWILNSTQSPVQVFCEMGDVFPSSINVTRGWVRVANLNMTDTNQQCPENLTLSYTNQPIRLCGRSTDYGCDSVVFTTYGVQYRQVCGRVRGYQFNSPGAFEIVYCPSCTIDAPYVDGISITHGTPRKHVWTYAAGVFGDQPGRYTCPCTGSGTPPLAFVGSDYYCEAGLDRGSWDSVLYSSDPLWDGQDCNGLEQTCCDPPSLPWFCKELPQPATDNLEFRICSDQDRQDEDTPIDLVQLYIQ